MPVLAGLDHALVDGGVLDETLARDLVDEPRVDEVVIVARALALDLGGEHERAGHAAERAAIAEVHRAHVGVARGGELGDFVLGRIVELRAPVVADDGLDVGRPAAQVAALALLGERVEKVHADAHLAVLHQAERRHARKMPDHRRILLLFRVVHVGPVGVGLRDGAHVVDERDLRQAVGADRVADGDLLAVLQLDGRQARVCASALVDRRRPPPPCRAEAGVRPSGTADAPSRRRPTGWSLGVLDAALVVAAWSGPAPPLDDLGTPDQHGGQAYEGQRERREAHDDGANRGSCRRATGPGDSIRRSRDSSRWRAGPEG